LSFCDNRRTAELRIANDSLAEHLALANEQLQDYDRTQKEFTNITSHEMKATTQDILGYSKLIQGRKCYKQSVNPTGLQDVDVTGC
jgi:light-regulated signal transduction histidine kinase (bacteriophytochrome)